MVTQNGQPVAGASIVVAKYEEGKAKLINHNVVTSKSSKLILKKEVQNILILKF